MYSNVAVFTDSEGGSNWQVMQLRPRHLHVPPVLYGKEALTNPMKSIKKPEPTRQAGPRVPADPDLDPVKRLEAGLFEDVERFCDFGF